MADAEEFRSRLKQRTAELDAPKCQARFLAREARLAAQAFPPLPPCVPESQPHGVSVGPPSSREPAPPVEKPPQTPPIRESSALLPKSASTGCLRRAVGAEPPAGRRFEGSRTFAFGSTCTRPQEAQRISELKLSRHCASPMKAVPLKVQTLQLYSAEGVDLKLARSRRSSSEPRARVRDGSRLSLKS